MPTMVLRVKVGADSCPCLSRPRSPAPVLGALLTLVLPTTPTQGAADGSAAQQGNKPHLMSFTWPCWSCFVPVCQNDRPRGMLPPVSNCLLSFSPLSSDCWEMKSRICWMLFERCPCEGAAFQEPFQGGAALMVSQHVPLQLFPALSLPSEFGCRVCATLKGRCPGDWATSPVAKGWLASS